MRTFLAICVSANLAAPAFGQHLEAGSPRLERGGSSSLATLETLIEQLQGQLAEQRELIAKNAQEIAEQRVLIDTLRRRVEGPGLGPDTRAADVSAQANTPVDHRPDPELPQKFVTGGDFPGSIEIPGTDTAFKIGGQARSTFVHSLQPLGEDDRFITSSIPVASVRPGDEARTTYTAAPSRLNFDFRSPSPFGGVRTFVEYDFSGTGNAADLRHAFIQGNHWIFGQTWSTFSDPEAQPTDIDFEGLNAISLFRQPQIRYTHPLRERLNASVAVENPAPALTGAAGVNVVPDFVARLRWDPPKPVNQLFTNVAHIQAAVLVRTLRGQATEQPDTTLSTGAFGVNVSGVLVPKWDAAGRVKFATNTGWGIGRYIKDLEAAGGQDAVYDSELGKLRALGVASGYVGYEHQWRPWLQGGLTYGLVQVGTLDIQAPTSLRRTQRASLNVNWIPVPHSQLIGEFLFGERVNKNGEKGRASQIQVGWMLTY